MTKRKTSEWILLGPSGPIPLASLILRLQPMFGEEGQFHLSSQPQLPYNQNPDIKRVFVNLIWAKLAAFLS